MSSLRPLCRNRLAATAFIAAPAPAQMPSPKEMGEAMRQMRRQLDKLRPEQRRMIEQPMQRTWSEAAPGSEDDAIGVPRRDAALIAKVHRQPLSGAQLKTSVESLQPKLRRAPSRDALRGDEVVEDVQRKAGGDLDPFALPFKVKWTEDLIKDRALTASAEIDLKGVTVGGRGAFDEDGLARGGASVDTGVGAARKAGPPEVGVSASGRVGVDFDRSGITDVRIETPVCAGATSGIEDTGAGSQVKTEVTGPWSRNGGTSASGSGGLDRRAFQRDPGFERSD